MTVDVAIASDVEKGQLTLTFKLFLPTFQDIICLTIFGTKSLPKLVGFLMTLGWT